MHVRSRVLLAAAAVWAAHPALAHAFDPAAPRRAPEVAPRAPVFCKQDSEALARLQDTDLQSFYSAFGHRLGWPGSIKVADPGQKDQYVMAAFAEPGADESQSRMVRFFFDPREEGLVLDFADFIEPDRPLMYADGDDLCDYVRAVLKAAAPPKR